MTRKCLSYSAFKSGERSQARNYRPISLTSHLFKVFEMVIRPQIVHFLESLGLMDGAQHGCRPGRSMLSQLIEQYDWILTQLIQGMNVDLLYLDFKKVFDKVDFSILMKKLKKLGIQGKLGSWLGKFMMGRLQAVKVGDQISDWVLVRSGIPQGSVIGPLLFLLMISDLGDDVDPEEAKVLKYVDDSKGMKAINSPEDVQSFQTVVNMFTE